MRGVLLRFTELPLAADGTTLGELEAPKELLISGDVILQLVLAAIEAGVNDPAGFFASAASPAVIACLVVDDVVGVCVCGDDDGSRQAD